MDAKRLINVKNTKMWVKANESSNSNKFRDAFVQRYGGIFKKQGSSWVWSEHFEEKIQPSRAWLFTRNDGVSFMVENFMEFCRINSLSKSAMYELMAGKRKSHKGFVKIDRIV
jgi:hypothetical protein